jgi:hypothetical protein
MNNAAGIGHVMTQVGAGVDARYHLVDRFFKEWLRLIKKPAEGSTGFASKRRSKEELIV